MSSGHDSNCVLMLCAQSDQGCTLYGQELFDLLSAADQL